MSTCVISILLNHSSVTFTSLVELLISFVKRSPDVRIIDPKIVGRQRLIHFEFLGRHILLSFLIFGCQVGLKGNVWHEFNLSGNIGTHQGKSLSLSLIPELVLNCFQTPNLSCLFLISIHNLVPALQGTNGVRSLQLSEDSGHTTFIGLTVWFRIPPQEELGLLIIKCRLSVSKCRKLWRFLVDFLLHFDIGIRLLWFGHIVFGESLKIRSTWIICIIQAQGFRWNNLLLDNRRLLTIWQCHVHKHLLGCILRRHSPYIFLFPCTVFRLLKHNFSHSLFASYVNHSLSLRCLRYHSTQPFLLGGILTQFIILHSRLDKMYFLEQFYIIEQLPFLFLAAHYIIKTDTGAHHSLIFLTSWREGGMLSPASYGEFL